jgi:hypothetical protein
MIALWSQLEPDLVTEPISDIRAAGDSVSRARARLEDVVHIRREGEADDIATIGFDPIARLIRAYAGGEWSFQETTQYVAALTDFVEAARSRTGKARVLLDRRDVSSQSAAVSGLLAQANGAIFRADDRIALVVSSSLAKASLRQRMPHPGTKAFLSIDAAETWLQAFRH